MRRKAAIVVALVGLVLAAAIGAAGLPGCQRACHRDEPDDLGRLERAGAERVQEGRGRVRRQEGGRLRQGGRLDQRRQDHRRPPLGERARRRELVHVAERRGLLPVGRLDRPRAVPEARQDQHEHLPGDDAVLHAVRRQALRAPAPRGRVRLLLQQAALQEGRPHSPAARPSRSSPPTRRSSRPARPTASLDVVGYDPFIGFYQNSIGAYQPLVGAKYFDAAGQVLARQGSRPGSGSYAGRRASSTTTGTTSSSSGRQAPVTSGRRPHAFGRGKLAMMIDGEWRVAFLAADHKGLAYGTAPMPVGQQEPLRLRLHQRDDHRHPEGRQEPGRGVEPRQVPDDEHPRARDVLERDPERSLDRRSGEVEGAEARPELRDVHEDLRQPEVGDDPRDPARLGAPRDASRAS